MSPGRKLCPKVILEGTRLTLKTELAFALNEHPRLVGPRRYRYHSPIVSAEWCGFTDEPWGRGPINYLPHEEARALETYRTWVRLFELNRYYSWIVDRFHLSTRLHQRRVHGREVDLDELEARLDELGFRLVHCTRAPESFEAALAERLEISGNPGQYAPVEEYVEQQEAFRELVAASRLRSVEVDVTDGDVPRAASAVADWLERTGGLWSGGADGPDRSGS